MSADAAHFDVEDGPAVLGGNGRDIVRVVPHDECDVCVLITQATRHALARLDAQGARDLAAMLREAANAADGGNPNDLGGYRDIDGQWHDA
jgi:hypothetical protein